MTEILVVIGFVVWYVASLMISEIVGKKRKIGEEWSFFLSMVFSPVIGFLVIFFSVKNKNGV